MDQGGLGGALSEGTSGDWSPQESKAILPSLRTFVNVGGGFPQPHGLEHTWINWLLVEQLLQKSKDLGASADYRTLLSPAHTSRVGHVDVSRHSPHHSCGCELSESRVCDCYTHRATSLPSSTLLKNCRHSVRSDRMTCVSYLECEAKGRRSWV